MNFTIFRNFLEFFWIYLSLFLILKAFKLIKNKAKRVHLLRGPTWMRRGTQGHVAEPRGPARVHAWHWGDVYTYIYLLYIGYSTYKHSIEELANRYNLPHLINPINLLFLHVGLWSLDFVWLQDAWRDVERRIEITRNDARRCGGREVHPISNRARASIKHKWNHHDRWFHEL